MGYNLILKKSWGIIYVSVHIWVLIYVWSYMGDHICVFIYGCSYMCTHMGVHICEHLMNGKFLCTNSGSQQHTFAAPDCRTAEDRSTVTPCFYPHESGYITQTPLTIIHRCTHIWARAHITYACVHIAMNHNRTNDMTPICSVRLINVHVCTPIYAYTYMTSLPAIMFIYVHTYMRIWVHIWTFICVPIYGWSYMGTHMNVHIWTLMNGKFGVQISDLDTVRS